MDSFKSLKFIEIQLACPATRYANHVAMDSIAQDSEVTTIRKTIAQGKCLQSVLDASP